MLVKGHESLKVHALIHQHSWAKQSPHEGKL